MIVLDTHIWLWWVENDRALSTARKELIESADVVAISVISCFEVAWLERHGRIILPTSRTDWFEKALEGSNVLLLPITLQIVNTAVDLPEHHRDPQDRLIIATAIAWDAFLMSADGQFPSYEELRDRLI